MARPIELVMFDCDGVLVDSERLAVRVDVRVSRVSHATADTAERSESHERHGDQRGGISQGRRVVDEGAGERAPARGGGMFHR
jgi:beta-phosphoglucomutase-like phosphatase (HAD superfamily)